VVDDAWCRTQLKTCAQWLVALDTEPRSLHDFIAQRPTRRLGQYFETLIAFLLAHIPDTQIIATNLQVQNAQRTLGEYDFLFRDADGNICHWETAVKFYLQAEPLSEQRAFIGLAVRDRLDIKLDRVFQHQLQLGHTPAGRAALPTGLVLQKTQAFIKGYLFYPATHAGKCFIPNAPSQAYLTTIYLAGGYVTRLAHCRKQQRIAVGLYCHAYAFWLRYVWMREPASWSGLKYVQHSMHISWFPTSLCKWSNSSAIRIMAGAK
jgi:hypothetical protein